MRVMQGATTQQSLNLSSSLSCCCAEMSPETSPVRPLGNSQSSWEMGFSQGAAAYLYEKVWKRRLAPGCGGLRRSEKEAPFLGMGLVAQNPPIPGLTLQGHSDLAPTEERARVCCGCLQ